MKTRLAIATVVESRDDFYELRKPLDRRPDAGHRLAARRVRVLSSRSPSARPVRSGLHRAGRNRFRAQALVVHIPIWGEPIFRSSWHGQLRLPTLLLGNDLPTTSSIVGVLGAGGALDQVGIPHRRVINHTDPANRRAVLAFVRAAGALDALSGQTLGLFGGRSLGILTAVADAAQWQRLFGVDIESIDQLRNRQRLAEVAVPRGSAGASPCGWRLAWAACSSTGVHVAGFERQVRCYLATRKLVDERGLRFRRREVPAGAERRVRLAVCGRICL